METGGWQNTPKRNMTVTYQVTIWLLATVWSKRRKFCMARLLDLIFCWILRESGPEVDQGPGGVITSPTLFGPSWCGSTRIIWDAEIREILQFFLGLLSTRPSSWEEKRVWNEWMNEWKWDLMSVCHHRSQINAETLRHQFEDSLF